MKFIKSACLVTLVVASGTLLAHGGEDHATKERAINKEQKDWGIAGDTKAVKRVINIKMLDTMRFSPDKIEVKQGDTVKFLIKNTGVVMHEFVIGTKKENDEHAELMVKFPNMEHDAPYMAHVGPGKSGEIVWTFNKSGEFDFACLIAGHYQAGMVGKISVLASASSAGLPLAPVQAQNNANETKVAQLTQSADMTDGEIRKVDKANRKLTIKHGEIKNLDMPGMTMVFQVKDPAILDKVKAGDKIKFTAEKSGTAFVVSDIQSNN